MATHTIPAPGSSLEATGKTRREAFAAFGVTVVAGISAAGFARPEALTEAGVGSDADLIAACRRHQSAFDQLTDLVRDHCDQYGVDMPETAYEEQGRLCELMCERVRDVRDLPATTLAGIRAKAQTLWLDEGELPGRESNTLLQSLLRDLRSGQPG